MVPGLGVGERLNPLEPWPLADHPPEALCAAKPHPKMLHVGYVLDPNLPCALPGLKAGREKIYSTSHPEIVFFFFKDFIYF